MYTAIIYMVLNILSYDYTHSFNLKLCLFYKNMYIVINLVLNCKIY